MKRDGDELGDEQGRGKRSRASNARACFKALFPDTSVSAVIGAKGAVRKAIEDSTGATLQISGRDQYFPETRCRVLTITGDDYGQVAFCVDTIIDRLIERAEQDLGKGKGRGEGDDVDTILGKEAGEYIFRAALPQKCSGALIGPKGANIKAMRRDIGAKVFVENNTFEGHQMVRVIGTRDILIEAVHKMIEIVENDIPADQVGDWAVSSITGGSTNWSPRASPRRGHVDQEHWGGGAGDGTCEPPEVEIQAAMALAGDFPQGSLDMHHAVSCELPRDQVRKLVGRGHSYVQHVKTATGCHIDIADTNFEAEPHQQMTITGPLCSVYFAHMLLMKRFHQNRSEEEQFQESRAEVDPHATVENLQEQLVALQAQLNVASGCNSGGKGKGKRR